MNADDLSRQLPHAIEHEKKLLSAMLLNGGEAIPNVAAKITAEEFYRPEHRSIFTALVKTYNKTPDPLNELLVMDELDRMKAHVSRSYFFGLKLLEYSTDYIHRYIEKIKETARLRYIISMASVALDEAFDGTKSAAEVTANLEKNLYKDDDKATADLESAKSIVDGVLEHTMKLLDSHDLTGVPTGLADLDKVLNGLQNSDLIFLAARPSMGKTALALSIAVNAANISTGNLNDNDLSALGYAKQDIAELPLFIDDTSTMTVGAIRAKAKKFKRDHGIQRHVAAVVNFVRLNVKFVR